MELRVAWPETKGRSRVEIGTEFRSLRYLCSGAAFITSGRTAPLTPSPLVLRGSWCEAQVSLKFILLLKLSKCRKYT